jgi:hypothetical protein
MHDGVSVAQQMLDILRTVVVEPLGAADSCRLEDLVARYREIGSSHLHATAECGSRDFCHPSAAIPYARTARAIGQVIAALKSELLRIRSAVPNAERQLLSLARLLDHGGEAVERISHELTAKPPVSETQNTEGPHGLRKPDTLTDPVLGLIRRDTEFGCWIGQTSVPSLAECSIRYWLHPDGTLHQQDSPTSTETRSIELAVSDKQGRGPCDEQLRAFKYFHRHEARIADAALAELVVVASGHYVDLLGDEGHGRLRTGVATTASQHGLLTPAGVRQQILLRSVCLLRQADRDLAYLSLDFDCGWDVEHGISLLLHKNQVVSTANRGDFRANDGFLVFPDDQT